MGNVCNVTYNVSEVELWELHQDFAILFLARKQSASRFKMQFGYL